jgi:hypothetical protein
MFCFNSDDGRSQRLTPKKKTQLNLKGFLPLGNNNNNNNNNNNRSIFIMRIFER